LWKHRPYSPSASFLPVTFNGIKTRIVLSRIIGPPTETAELFTVKNPVLSVPKNPRAAGSLCETDKNRILTVNSSRFGWRPYYPRQTFGFMPLNVTGRKDADGEYGRSVSTFEGSFPAPFRDLLMVSKFDHHFNSAQSLSFRASFQRNTSREGLRIDPNISVGGPPTASAFQVATNENISWQATHAWMLSSRTLNHSLLQFNRFIKQLGSTSQGINLRFSLPL